MAVLAARNRQALAIGNIFEDAWNGLEDVATSIVDDISDAGSAIGSVLKFVAPIIALVPGWGTAISVALEAAAAWASQDSLQDAIVEIVGGAMPGPVTRAAFDSAADVTKTALDGGDVGAAAIAAGRRAASSFGGKQGEAAYDVGLQVARGAKVSDASWALARSQVSQQGPAALAAFDAAVTIHNGGNALDATRAALRAYLETTGSAPTLVAFDMGVALAQGKSLQDAGFSALKNFVAGNTGLDRATNFAERMIKASRSGKALAVVLEDELSSAVGQYGVQRAAEVLGPVIAQWNQAWNEWGVSSLAERLGISDLMAQAAQAIMRSGTPDAKLYAKLTQTGIESAIAKFGAAVIASKAVNESYTQVRAEERADQLTLEARLPASSLSYATAAAQIAASAPVSVLGRVKLPAGAAPAVVATPPPPLSPPPPDDVAQAPAAPSSPRTGALGNVALGLTVTLACLSLVWWARSP